ncbi:MAG: CoA transferase, partial [Acidimicrobiales bacterium]
MNQPFDGLRVIDLSGLVGAYASRLLAALGAEVIKIEPPGGSPLRRMAPFIEDGPERESSLWWAYLAMGTRSVVIDIEDHEHRNKLAALMQTADIVVDDHGPDVLDGLGIGYEATRVANPGVIWIAITPFGATGPKRSWASSNLVAWAAS